MQKTNKVTSERTCIGCRKKENKTNLFRILKTSDGTVVFDKTSKRDGRGAYVCSLDCFDAAIKDGRFARALRIKLGKEFCQIREEICFSSLEEVV